MAAVFCSSGAKALINQRKEGPTIMLQEGSSAIRTIIHSYVVPVVVSSSMHRKHRAMRRWVWSWDTECSLSCLVGWTSVGANESHLPCTPKGLVEGQRNESKRKWSHKTLSTGRRTTSCILCILSTINCSSRTLRAFDQRDKQTKNLGGMGVH